MKFELNILMRKIILVCTLLFTFSGNAQKGLGDKGKSEECACCKTKEIREKESFSPKYGIWECGRSDQIVDCNEVLEYDENSNTVIHKRTGKPFTGDCETCHFNGIRERLIHFEGGKDQGIDSSYFMSGCLMAVRTMLDGIEDGEQVLFYDSIGTEAWRENYAYGKKHGQQIYYDKDHKPKKIEHYYDGVLNGNKKVFFPGTFKIRQDINYKMNQLEGTYQTFVQNDTGTVMVINYNYKAGQKEGVQETFYDMGAVMSTEEYKKGLKHGPTTHFYADGTVMKAENYVKGLRQGEFQHFRHDGKVSWEAEYKKDKLIIETYYDEFGNPIEPERPEGEEAPDEESGKGKKKKKKKSKKKKKEKTKKEKNSEE